MASRFQQRDARSSLFSSYDQSRSRPSSASPASRTYAPPTSSYAPSGAFSAYPSSTPQAAPERSRSAVSFEKKGYNTAVLDELESQNDSQVSEMGKRVAMLKDITIKIGDEIRDSTALAEKMNDSFGVAGVKLKGTMNRMLRMAERTGVGWKVWLGFFAAVGFLFWYVWLF
ncbi:Protein transport protein bet1 [Sphaceloma murrayae]|uniref:Protein transport protein bet1 n=1 Tax=Sphaceloma murrayae TaxID=2082308 RepID=A0A2K1QG68_9PEZI|nr:Protein transport protein bet1 [Sphaceloma murrayae]